MTSTPRSKTPKAQYKEVKELKLDLRNFRTVPQATEEDAVHAMITISPDYFYGLLDSIINDGYVPIENIVVLDDAGCTVKEGNRRVACLKLVHGYLKSTSFNLPTSLLNRIVDISPEWKTENAKVPCLVYSNTEADTVDKIVSKTHGKGEKAGRDNWPSVARSRHNRDMNGASEPALDLLEKYFEHGKNITANQKETWAGSYPLSVLDEAMKKLALRVGLKSAAEMAKNYPNINHKTELEKILSNIGGLAIGFKEIRDTETDFAVRFGGFPEVVTAAPATSVGAGSNSAATGSTTTTGSNAGAGSATASTPASTIAGASSAAGSTAGTGSTGTSNAASAATTATPAFAVSDHKGVTKTLKEFFPSGLNRSKVVTLRDEAIALKLPKNPLAFCFLLRSMFEISARLYFEDNTLNLQKPNPQKPGMMNDKTLKELLTEAKNHLTANGTNKTMTKQLHGAITELGKADGILSVTSLNQLVHSPTFVVTDKDISVIFGNVYPLLKALN